MPGFANDASGNSIMWSDNVDFSGAVIPSRSVTTNGQLLIGSTAAPNIKTGTLTSPSGSITLGYSAPNITLEVSGGTTTVQTLTPDLDFDGTSGTPVTPQAGTINALGYQIGTSLTRVTDTINSTGASTGNFQIENRTWFTPYVVDASTTAGTRGTYSTIASAITAAVADGASTVVGKLIYIRNGTYTENLTIPNGIILQGQTSADTTISSLGVVVTGTVTISTTEVNLRNIRFESVGSTLITSTAGALVIDNCFLNGAANIGLSVVNGPNIIINSYITGGVSAAAATTTFKNTEIAGTLALTSTASVQIYYTQLSSITLANTASFIANFCRFTSPATISGTAGTACTLTSCTYSNTGANGPLITATGIFYIENIVNTAGITSVGGVYNTSPTIRGSPSIQGNILTSVNVTTATYNTTLNDYYIGLNRAGTIAVSVVTTNLAVDKILIFKDESGAAASNNITLTPSSGTIDGASSYVINVNYQSVTLKFNGTNFFIL